MMVAYPHSSCFCRINLKENKKMRDHNFCLDNECWKTCEQEVFLLLERALSDRAKLVRVTWKSTPNKWDISDVSYFGRSKFLNKIMKGNALFFFDKVKFFNKNDEGQCSVNYN